MKSFFQLSFFNIVLCLLTQFIELINCTFIVILLIIIGIH